MIAVGAKKVGDLQGKETQLKTALGVRPAVVPVANAQPKLKPVAKAAVADDRQPNSASAAAPAAAAAAAAPASPVSPAAPAVQQAPAAPDVVPALPGPGASNDPTLGAQKTADAAKR
jgi:hypothetical protein